MNQQTYQDAYTTLKTNADLLQNTNNVDIDTLMDVVNDSINAYKVCKARIDAVEKALNDAFDTTQND